MRHTARRFRKGQSQAVRLPSEFHFDGKEVFIRKDPETGDVILSRFTKSWESFFALADQVRVPEDFMSERHDEESQKRDLF